MYLKWYASSSTEIGFKQVNEDYKNYQTGEKQQKFSEGRNTLG